MPLSALRRCHALAAGLSLLSAAVLCAAPAAHADAPTHTSLFSYSANPELECPMGCPPTRFPPPREGLEDACGVAVDSQGDIYASDYYHDAVDVFNLSSETKYLTQIKSESNNGNGPCAVAVDPAGNVYVNNWRQNVVKFAPLEFPPTLATTYGAGALIDSGIQGRGGTGVAVDPATGNLYVDDRTYVAVYEAPIAPGDEPLAKIGLGTVGKGYGVAVSDFAATKGYVYVADSISATIKAYDPTVSLVDPVQVIDGAGTPQAGFSSLVDASLAIDQSNGHLFVVDDLLEPFEHPAAVVDEFNASGVYRGQFAQALVDAEPSGLAVDSARNVYLTGGNSENSAIYGFGPTFPAHTLAVAKSGPGAGTVNSEPAGIACGAACAAEYNVGSEITLTASPSPGSAFAGWTVNANPNTCPGVAGACHLTLDTDVSVSAEFIVAPPLASAGPVVVSGATSAVAPAASPTTAGPPSRQASNSRSGRRHRHHRHRKHGGRAQVRSH